MPEEKSPQEQRSEFFQAAYFGERYRAACFARSKFTSEVQSQILKFLEKKSGFLTFTGNPGIGKTYLCSCLVGWAANEFNSVRYWNERQLLQRVREGMDLRGDFLESLKLLIDDDFLIIDDLGSSGVNEWRTGVLFDAVDYRYESMKSTVVTSNFDRTEIPNLFGARFASRIFAAENVVISLHGGQDLRKHGL